MIAFSGQTAFDFDGAGASLRQPTFDIAQKLYQEGYDIFYYDVNKHNQAVFGDLEGAATEQAKTSVEDREVQELTIWGWSHGGGATYQLSKTLQRLKQNGRLAGLQQIAGTAYIDAVRYRPGFGLFSETANWTAESRKPVWTVVHGNWYQRNKSQSSGRLVGTSVPGSTPNLDLSNELTNPAINDHKEVVVYVDKNGLLVDFFKSNAPPK